MAFGTEPTPTGLADPPIDDLMEHADSKYALAIFAATVSYTHLTLPTIYSV